MRKAIRRQGESLLPRKGMGPGGFSPMGGESARVERSGVRHGACSPQMYRNRADREVYGALIERTPEVANVSPSDIELVTPDPPDLSNLAPNSQTDSFSRRIRLLRAGGEGPDPRRGARHRHPAQPRLSHHQGEPLPAGARSHPRPFPPAAHFLRRGGGHPCGRFENRETRGGNDRDRLDQHLCPHPVRRFQLALPDRGSSFRRLHPGFPPHHDGERVGQSIRSRGHPGPAPPPRRVGRR